MIDFDKTFYKRVYTDLRFLNDAQLTHHYITTGKKEHRLGSEYQLNKFIDSLPYKFDPGVYKSLYSDVPGDETLAKIHLYMHGHREGRIYNTQQAKNSPKPQGTNALLKSVPPEDYNNMKPITGNKKLNILIYTHDKPTSFQYCLNSVLTQTYKNVHVYICIKDLKDVEYVNKLAIGHENITVIMSRVKKGNELHNYNQYNELLSCVGEGWLIFLDEVDELTSPETLATIYKSITTDNTVLLWQHSRDSSQVQSIDKTTTTPEHPVPVSTFCAPISLSKNVTWSNDTHAVFNYIRTVSSQPTASTNVISKVLIKSQQSNVI